MPPWAILMLITAALVFWGWLNGAWEIPALALCGYIGTRLAVAYAPTEYLEVVICAVWLFFAAIMIYRGGAIPGFFFVFSALTYPVLFVIGYRIEFMGLTPFIADAFAVLALLTIGGGIYGVANSTTANSGVVGWFQSHSVGMATSKKSANSSL